MSFKYGRVEVKPGKHGPADRKVTFCGKAPTAGELLAMVGGVFEAEDRYSGKRHYGRDLFMQYIRSAYHNGIDLGELCRQADDKKANGQKDCEPLPEL